MISPMRRASFQAKVILAIVLVVVLATLAGYWFINRSVQRAFSDFTVRSVTRQDQVLIGLITLYYREAGTLEGVADRLAEQNTELSVLIVNPDREVEYAPEDRLIGMRLAEEQLEQGVGLRVSDEETWTVIPYRYVPGRQALEDAFLRTTGHSLWLAGLGAALAGILLSFLLARQLTHPLRRLEAAALRIAQGDLSNRVEIVSSDEIGHVAESFNEMAESLEIAEATKQQMIADISHELRTPLTAVRTALEGLRDGLVEPSQETFASLHDRILLFTRLVNDLHQLTLADTGRLSIRRTPCHVETIIEGIVDTIGVQAEDAGLELRERVEPNLPILYVDPHRIEQVLLNLLANAVRHTPERGWIEIAASAPEERTVEITVCDSGPGLSPEDLAHVFDRFYRSDASRTRLRADGTAAIDAPDAGGAGLGLSIAKALIEAHGGTIRAENGPDGGACFRIRLPLGDPEDLDTHPM